MNHVKFSHFVSVRAKRSAFVAFVSLVAFSGAATALAQTAPAPMSLSEMSALVDSLLATVQSLTAQIAQVGGSQSVAPAAVPDLSISTPGIDVTAENGKITTSSFTFKSSEQKPFFIYALDADYPFQMTENGIDMVIQKGTKVEIPLGSLGAGAHVFSCGPDCTGTINIESEDDGDQPTN